MLALTLPFLCSTGLEYDLGTKQVYLPTLRVALTEIDDMKRRLHQVKNEYKIKTRREKNEEQKSNTTEKFDIVIDDLKQEFLKISQNSRYMQE